MPTKNSLEDSTSLKQMLAYYEDYRSKCNPQGKNLKGNTPQRSSLQTAQGSTPDGTDSTGTPRVFSQSGPIFMVRNDTAKLSLLPERYAADTEQQQYGQIQLQCVLSRESISQMNKRHRIRRNQQYRQLTRENTRTSLIDPARKYILEPAFTSRNLQNKMPQGPPNKIASPQHKLKPLRKQKPQDNPQSSHKIQSSGEKKSSDVIRNSFSASLKVKRIDDNPKLLGCIIKRKFHQLEKQELYDYVHRLIKRREYK